MLAPTVDRDFVPARAECPEVGVSDKRSVRFASEESILAGYKQPAIR